MQVYHGSGTKFNEFKIQRFAKNASLMGYGIYLTDSKERAKCYADQYLYTVQFDNTNSKTVSSTELTMTLADVVSIYEAVAKKQIETDGYPYILSDWGEPTSDTEIDAENQLIALQAAKSTFETADNDLDVINEIYHECGNDADLLTSILSEMNIHYSVQNFVNMLTGEVSKEYVVFNPKDIQILAVQSN